MPWRCIAGRVMCFPMQITAKLENISQYEAAYCITALMSWALPRGVAPEGPWEQPICETHFLSHGGKGILSTFLGPMRLPGWYGCRQEKTGLGAELVGRVCLQN